MIRLLLALLLFSVCISLTWADMDSARTAPEKFLIQDSRGLAFLGTNGAERERMEKWAANGVFSPDGRWLACVEFDRETSQCKLLIRAREKLKQYDNLPLVRGTI